MPDAIKFRCPKCDFTDYFDTFAECKIILSGDGGLEYPSAGDSDIAPVEDDAWTTCHGCGHAGPLSAFRVEWQATAPVQEPIPSPDKKVSRLCHFGTQAEAIAFIAGIELVNDSAVSTSEPVCTDGHPTKANGWEVYVYDEDDPGDEEANDEHTEEIG